MWEEKLSLNITSPVLLFLTSNFPLDHPVISSGTPSLSRSKLCRHIGWFLDCDVRVWVCVCMCTWLCVFVCDSMCVFVCGKFTHLCVCIVRTSCHKLWMWHVSVLEMRQCGPGMWQCGLGMWQCGLGMRQCGLGMRQCGLGMRQCGLGMWQCGQGMWQCGLGMAWEWGNVARQWGNVAGAKLWLKCHIAHRSIYLNPPESLMSSIHTHNPIGQSIAKPVPTDGTKGSHHISLWQLWRENKTTTVTVQTPKNTHRALFPGPCHFQLHEKREGSGTSYHVHDVKGRQNVISMGELKSKVVSAHVLDFVLLTASSRWLTIIYLNRSTSFTLVCSQPSISWFIY